MQSQALHAFAYVLAGARRWALAAARDAQVDQRLLAADDAFFFEFGRVERDDDRRWNISSRNEIQATNQERRQKFAEWQVAHRQNCLLAIVKHVQAGEIPAAWWMAWVFILSTDRLNRSGLGVNGQRSTVNEQRQMNNCQRTTVNEQLSTNNCQRTTVNERW